MVEFCPFSLSVYALAASLERQSLVLSLSNLRGRWSVTSLQSAGERENRVFFSALHDWCFQKTGSRQTRVREYCRGCYFEVFVLYCLLSLSLSLCISYSLSSITPFSFFIPFYSLPSTPF